METVAEALAYLSAFTDWEQLLHHAPERTTFDLSRFERFLAHLGSPQQDLDVLHVTGTKGKSSTTVYGDAILRAHGLHTFRFLSPHLLRVNERLSVQGEDVSDATFVDLVRQLVPVIERLRGQAPGDLPSFFEAVTAMGFSLAQQSRVDVAVLEVGLGGRLDATNVATARVAVITSVALEHTRILGDTVEAIAREKAGIVKPGCQVWTGFGPEHPAFPVVADRARAVGATLRCLGQDLTISRVEPFLSAQGFPHVRFDVAGPDFQIRDMVVPGGSPHEAANAALALAAAVPFLQDRGLTLEPERCRATFAHLRVDGRCVWIPGQPDCLVDGAHTAESVAAVAAVAERLAGNRPIHLLCGLTRDRDPARVLGAVLDRASRITATALPTPRSLPAEALAAALGPEAAAVAEPELARAVESARANAHRAGAMLLVVGSLYLAGSVLPLLRSAPTPSPE